MIQQPGSNFINTTQADSNSCYYCAADASVSVDLDWTEPFPELKEFSQSMARPELLGLDRPAPVNHGIFPVLAIMTIAYLVIYRMAPARFTLTLTSFFNHRLIHEQSKDDANVSVYYQFSMLLLALASVSLFTTELLKWRILEGTQFIVDQYWLVVLLLVIGISIWLGVKVLLLNLSGNLFKVTEHLREYINTIFHYTHISGLLLFLVLVGIHFFEWPTLFNAGSVSSQPFLNIGLIIIGFFYILRLAKTLYFGSWLYSISLYYNILYLCALEILPLMIVARWVTSSWLA